MIEGIMVEILSYFVKDINKFKKFSQPKTGYNSIKATYTYGIIKWLNNRDKEYSLKLSNKNVTLYNSEMMIFKSTYFSLETKMMVAHFLKSLGK